MTTRTVKAAAPGASAAPLHSPSSTRARWAVALSTLTIAGIVAYAALVVTAQLLPPHYNVVRTAESDLAVGRYGWLMTTAFVLRGALSLALVAALALAARRGLRPRAGLVLLGLWGAAAFLLAAFPTDLPGDPRTVHGAVHAAVAFAAFLAVALGELLVSRRLATVDRWRRFGRLTARLAAATLVVCVLALVALGATTTTSAGPAAFAGLAERAFLVMALLWMLLVAARLRTERGVIEPAEAPAAPAREARVSRRAALTAAFRRRPRTWATAMVGVWLAVTLASALTLRAVAPGLSRQSQSLIVLGVLSVLVAATLSGLGWWRAVGFNGRGEWRSPRLLVLPAVLVVLPLVGGWSIPAAGTLAILVAGYALTGFAEEAFARGILLRVLAPRGALGAVLISSLLFGVMHLSNVLFRSSPGLVAAQAVGAACFGVGYAALRLRTNTLWPLLALHMLTDLFGQLAKLPAIPFFVTQDVILLAYGLYLVRGLRAGQALALDDAGEDDEETVEAAQLREAA